MANAITTIQKYIPLLDQVYAVASCSATVIDVSPSLSLPPSISESLPP